MPQHREIENLHKTYMEVAVLSNVLKVLTLGFLEISTQRPLLRWHFNRCFSLEPKIQAKALQASPSLMSSSESFSFSLFSPFLFYFC